MSEVNWKTLEVGEFDEILMEWPILTGGGYWLASVPDQTPDGEFHDDALKIVTAVNYHERLVEMVRALAFDYHNATGGDHHGPAHELLAELLDTKKD